MIARWEQEFELLRYLECEALCIKVLTSSNFKFNFTASLAVILRTLMVSKTMTTQKKKDLKNQYQAVDLKEYDVMCTHTTAYPSRRVVTGEQWSEKIHSKRQVKSTPPSPVEKVSTSEVIDTKEEVQFKKSPKKSLKEKLQDKDDLHRYSTSDIQIMSYLLDMPDTVTIQYQEGEESVPGTQSVSLQMSLPSYQNITEETVIEAQPSGSKKVKKVKK